MENSINEWEVAIISRHLFSFQISDSVCNNLKLGCQMDMGEKGHMKVKSENLFLKKPKYPVKKPIWQPWFEFS